MSLPAAAFFKRSLRVGSRLGRTYLVRAGLLLVMLVALLSVHATQAFFGAPGLRLFGSIAYINFFLICLAGPAYFASAITEEKEGRTLGLLQMTGLSAVSILLGTSTSQMLSAIMLLLAQVPFTLLAVTLGGVSPLQILATYAALVALMVFVSNLALFCSALCLRTTGAAGLTGILLLLFFVAPPLGGAIVAGLVSEGVLAGGGFIHTVSGTLFKWMKEASAYEQIGRVMSTGFSGSPIGFQVLSNLGLGAFFFLVTWAGFDVFTRRQKESAPARGLAFRRKSRLRALGVGRVWQQNPFAWKDFYFTAGGKVLMLAKFLGYGLVLAGMAFLAEALGNRLDREEFGAMAMVVMLGIGSFELVVYHSRVFGSERKWQTLASLMVVPMSTRGIAYRKMFGCVLALAPAAAYFALGAVLCPEGLSDVLEEMLSEPTGWYFVIQALCFLQFVAYLSLVLRRGALLVAFAIWFVGHWLVLGVVFAMLMPAFVFGLDEDVVFVGLTVAMFGLGALLHYKTLRRLERAAAAE